MAVLVGVKVRVGDAVKVAVFVGVSVKVGVAVIVGLGVAVGVTYSASTERKWTCPPDALTDQFRHPAGTVRIKLLNPAALLLDLRRLVVRDEEQAVTTTLPTPVP